MLHKINHDQPFEHLHNGFTIGGHFGTALWMKQNFYVS